MDRRPAPDFSSWIVNHGDRKPAQMLPRPRPALVVTTRLYDGTTATLEVDVVARARGYVCVQQPRRGDEPWCAWVPDGAVSVGAAHFS